MNNMTKMADFCRFGRCKSCRSRKKKEVPAAMTGTQIRRGYKKGKRLLGDALQFTRTIEKSEM